MKIEVSNGEIMDKLSILEIKLKKIRDQGKLLNVQKEYDSLKEPAQTILALNHPLYQALLDVWA